MRDMSQKQIGNAIKIGLKRKSMSQQRLSEIVFVHFTTVSKWTKGEQGMPVSMFIKIVKLLEIEDLFFTSQDVEISQRLYEIETSVRELRELVK